MDVYLVPVGAERYEPYCEVPDEPEDEATVESRGFIRRAAHRFREMIAEAEHERRHGTPEGTQRGWAGRMKARIMRWVAESIAEQRLLWHLRRQTDACLFFPDDIDEPRAAGLLRQQLGRDYDKHKRWLAIDSVILAVSTPVLFWLPGPNVIGYYFLFRVVGHYFSLRGASRGLNAVQWRHQPSAPLTELRRVLAMDPALREPRVHAVAEMLRLEHLASFFQRTAVSA